MWSKEDVAWLREGLARLESNLESSLEHFRTGMWADLGNFCTKATQVFDKMLVRLDNIATALAIVEVVETESDSREQSLIRLVSSKTQENASKLEPYFKMDKGLEVVNAGTFMLTPEGRASEWHYCCAKLQEGITRLGWVRYLTEMRDRVAPEGPVIESNAIARYVARSKTNNPLYDSTLIDYGHIKQRVDFASMEIDASIAKWFYPRRGFGVYLSPAEDAANAALMRALGALSTLLPTAT